MDNNNTPDSTDQTLQLNRRRLLKTGLGAVIFSDMRWAYACKDSSPMGNSQSKR